MRVPAGEERPAPGWRDIVELSRDVFITDTLTKTPGGGCCLMRAQCWAQACRATNELLIATRSPLRPDMFIRLRYFVLSDCCLRRI